MPWKPKCPGDFPSLGWEILEWCTEHLPSPRDPSQPLVFTDAQARRIVERYRLHPRSGNRVYRRGFSRRSKGVGKALALDTRLPTPSGWTTMGDVRVGDYLLDENGLPTAVVAATDVMSDRLCYRVTFRDGTAIVADADHLWPVDEFRGKSQRRRVTRTTAELAAAGLRFARPIAQSSKVNVSGVARWRTLPTPAIAGSEVDPPFPPYVLGYWLGDGDSDQPRITVHGSDLEHLTTRCNELGITLGTPKVKLGTDTYRIRFGNASLQTQGTSGHGWAVRQLRGAGVLGNKHIPVEWLRASLDQRLELLRGLMDSDGSIDAKGKIEFCSTSESLAMGVLELIRSIGLYPSCRVSAATLYGRTIGNRWRITFTAFDDDRPVFSLPRKADRLKQRGPSIPYSHVRTIVAIDPVPSVPVRCVTVAGASALYLAGDGMIPTHNSPNEAAICIAEFAGPVRFGGWDADGEPVARPWGTMGDQRSWVQIGALNEDQTGNTWSVVNYFMTENDGKAADALRIDAALTRCVLLDQPGARLEPITSAAKTKTGVPITHALLDESHLMTASNGGVLLAKTMKDNAAKTGGTSYETTNAFLTNEKSVAEESYAAVRKGARDIYADDIEAPRIIGGIPVDELASDKILRQALEHAYEDSYWVDLDRLIAERRDPATVFDEWARYFLNWNQAGGYGWKAFSKSDWGARAGQPGDLVADSGRAALQVGEGQRDAALSFVARRNDGKLQTEIAKHLPGTGWLLASCKKANADTGQPIWYNPKSPTAGVVDELAAGGVDLHPITPAELATGSAAFQNDVLHSGLVHLNALGLQEAARLAEIRKSGATWTFAGDDSVELHAVVVGCIAARAPAKKKKVAVGFYGDDDEGEWA